MIEKSSLPPNTEPKPWGQLTEAEKDARLKDVLRATASGEELRKFPGPIEKVPTLANDRQVAGNHYRSGIQHWDFVAANKLDYFQGQITKYVCRWKHKNGIEDLEKARHFLDKYIELAEAEACEPQSRGYVDQG